MKKFLILFALTCSISLQAQTTLKVLSINVHAGYDATMDQIADFIKAQAPDIVMLQEVEFFMDRSKSTNPRPNNNNINMLLEISHRVGMQGMFFSALEKIYGGNFGNAILSKYCFDETYKIMLPFVKGTEQRNAGVVRVTLPNKTSISFVVAHLDMANSANGLNQILSLNKIPKGDPIILGGDLNKRTGTEHINALTNVWTLAFLVMALII